MIAQECVYHIPTVKEASRWILFVCHVLIVLITDGGLGQYQHKDCTSIILVALFEAR